MRLVRRISSVLVLAALAALASRPALAQCVSLTTLGSAYTQNFDTLSNTAGSTTNNLTITGWFLTESGGGARDNEQYAVDTGGSTTGDMYSYGVAGSTERALGQLRSGTVVSIFGACFTNNTGATIDSLAITYNGEEWRLGAAARIDQVNFEYSTNATDLVTGTWNGVAALNFVTPDMATTGAKNGNAFADRTALSSTISSMSIANGATFWIRWTDTDATGADDGLAVDDFSLTPNGTRCISLMTLGSAYTQNFDTLSNTAGSTTNNLTIPGWFMTESGGGARDNEQYAVDTGGSTTGDMYSYGAAGSTERALGQLRTGTVISIFGACFTNNTGATIGSLTIAYKGEEWRLGAAARTDQINFEYSTNATDLVTGAWNGVAALNFITPDTVTTGAKNGNAAADRTALSSTVSSLSIANGATFWIRWTDTDAASADDGLAADDFSLTPHGVGPVADLSITETDGVVTALPGGSVTYTITATNAGPDTETGAMVADTFPALLTCTWICTGAGGGTCTASGSGNLNDAVTLPSGGSAIYTATCAINASATGTLSNTAIVTNGSTLETNTADNTATDIDTLTPQADLSVTNTDGVTSAPSGGSVTYTLVISSAGPSNATGATVADSFPASLACAWTCTGSGGGTCTASGSGNLNDTVTLPSGGSVTYTASCAISASAAGTLSNVATVAAPAGVTDPTPGNNSATDSDALDAQCVSLTTLGAAYTQNFDTLSNVAGSTTNNLTIPGWFLTESGGGARDNEQYAVDTGGSTTGDMYSYGAAASTDRALGSLRAGVVIPIFGACFTNNTGATIGSLAIAYNGEEWRLGTAARTDQVNFEYSTDATDLVTGTWNGVAALNFVTPDTVTTGAKNGNASADRTALSSTISALSIPNGATLWIRWTDTDVSSAEDGLTVDDFSMTPNGVGLSPIPVADPVAIPTLDETGLALLALVLAALGTWAMRKRRA
jgi:uncharacterized repeat protein (TIGR01451 family)